VLFGEYYRQQNASADRRRPDKRRP